MLDFPLADPERDLLRQEYLAALSGVDMRASVVALGALTAAPAAGLSQSSVGWHGATENGPDQ